jgi:hypothetical protein
MLPGSLLNELQACRWVSLVAHIRGKSYILISVTNFIIELQESPWVLPGFRIVLDNVIYGTVEDHEPRGVTRYNLGQNPGGRAYLIIPTLVGYQAVQNLLPDALLVLGGNPVLAPRLNCRKPVFEGVHVARGSAFS